MVTKRSKPTQQMDASTAITQRVNYISLECDIPVDVARAMLGVAYTTVAVSDEDIPDEARVAMVQTYTECFGLLAKPLGIIDEKMMQAIKMSFDQARAFLKDIEDGFIKSPTNDLFERLVRRMQRGGRR